MVMEVGILDAGGLRTLLRERAAQCLLLDCRSFFAFNAGHIAGSVNVRFSTIVRRRAKGAMGLEHIVPNAELRGRLLAGAYQAVVLLDERSAALDGAKRDCTLALAAGALCREARAAQVFFLKGTRPGSSGPCARCGRRAGDPLALCPWEGARHLERVSAGALSQRTSHRLCLALRTKTCLSLSDINSQPLVGGGVVSRYSVSLVLTEKKIVFVLSGGYEAFSASCPELCSKQSTPTGLSLPLSTSVPDSAESGCSSCSTPLYDQVSSGLC